MSGWAMSHATDPGRPFGGGSWTWTSRRRRSSKSAWMAHDVSKSSGGIVEALSQMVPDPDASEIPEGGESDANWGELALGGMRSAAPMDPAGAKARAVLVTELTWEMMSVWRLARRLS